MAASGNGRAVVARASWMLRGATRAQRAGDEPCVGRSGAVRPSHRSTVARRRHAYLASRSRGERLVLVSRRVVTSARDFASARRHRSRIAARLTRRPDLVSHMPRPRSTRLAPLLVAVAALVAASVALARPAHAQQGANDAERGAVIAVVQKVFDAMRTRDTALLRQAFDTSARMVGVAARGGPPVVRGMHFEQFGAAISKAPAGDVWNERIFDPEVRIDGDVAQVWAYYTFHRNQQFSHCGVDAFMLLKVGTEWKITQLADSRRTTGCTHTEPPGN
jgi:hypothetical protein